MATRAPPPRSDRPIDFTSGEMTYRYRPRMVGAEFSFRLEPDALAWELGRRNGRLAYRDIARLRLGYRPANLGGHRFVAEIWSREGTKLEIASISQRSLFDYQNLAAEYRAFVVELARRIAASGGACRCDAGFPPWRWWPAVIFGAVTIGTVGYFAMHALFSGQPLFIAMIAALGAFFAWQIGLLLVRNRPRLCELRSIPAEVLP